jgi:hypothetical protein
MNTKDVVDSPADFKQEFESGMANLIKNKIVDNKQEVAGNMLPQNSED